MERSHILTKDGSSSIFVPLLNECYHSRHGAIQESKHVFINHGLSLFENQAVSILEFGFGTGLNALLTWLSAKRLNLNIRYHTLEKYPLSESEWTSVNYAQTVDDTRAVDCFKAIHESRWGEEVALDESFSICKQKVDFKSIEYQNQFDLIYFDAFSPSSQPDLWTEEVFLKSINALKPGGFLVTYCSKSSVRRAMEHVGFKIEKLPGPPGKREMIRASICQPE